ncbi:helix-turn-helix domain-containing protein [Embleya sp. AB8]|uniref:helix-turn-helix domain-containing protein n=1 Tax=Embleya sp. AB8 TaxID=3156304 RepID=UPI003C73FFA8
MIEPAESGNRRADLAKALKTLRLDSGLTGDRLALRANMSQSKVSKIENGKTLPSVLDVDRIIHALGVPADLADELLALARLANTEFHDVRSSLRRGLQHRQRDLAALEASATALRYFLPVMLTGLLHTPEYAKASMGAGNHALAIARRLERQSILYDESKSFTFLITEPAARWPLCPAPVMAVQIDRLISLSRLPNLRLGVIPMTGVLPDGPLNTFTVYDERLATAETFGGLVVMRDPRDISLHLETFAGFERHAIFGSPVRAWLESLAAEFRAR